MSRRVIAKTPDRAGHDDPPAMVPIFQRPQDAPEGARQGNIGINVYIHGMTVQTFEKYTLFRLAV